MSDIEGNATRVGASERGQRTSFKTPRYRGKAKGDLQNQFVGTACEDQTVASTTGAATIENGKITKGRKKSNDCVKSETDPNLRSAILTT